MLFPVNIHIGSITILLHTVTEWVGMFIGYRYFLFLRRKQHDTISDNSRISILIGAMIGALIGSRIIGTLENIPGLLHATNKWWFIYNNKTVLGGLLVGVWAVEITKLIIKENKPTGDLLVYPLLLAIIIGRIGCFSMGIYEETYGTVTSFFTGMNLGDGLNRHPVALYEIVFLVCLWITLLNTQKKLNLKEGSSFKIMMICYLLFRFSMECIKPSLVVFAGLSTLQITSILGLLYYYRYLLHPYKLIHV